MIYIHIYDLLKEYINNIQRDDASLYCVSFSFNKIKDHFNSEIISESFQAIKNVTLDLINEKWNKHINVDIINTTNFFNFNIDLKITKNVIKFIEKWGSLYLFNNEIFLIFL